MKTVISAEQMKRIDKRAIEEFGIPSRVLMENAGKSCADLLHSCFVEDLSDGAVVLCGSGNNGGDGYVISRWLRCYGYAVYIVNINNGNSSAETLANRELCEKMMIEFISPEDEDFEEFFEDVLYNSGVVIDALYGIGFKGELEEAAADLIEKINNLNIMKVAIDIPSGVNADTGYAKLAFRADLTLTLASLKYGHLLGRGKICSGTVEVIPIGIPDIVWKDEKAATLLDENTVGIVPRYKYAHKGDCGKIAVFAGSPGYTGAAFMASLAALKAGAGLVTIFCHPKDLQYYDSKPYEVIVNTIPVQSDNKINVSILEDMLKPMDTILFGPGCGVNDLTWQLLRFIAECWTKPAVIDADGLNTLAQHQELYAKLADKPVILTPHWGEFCRLAAVDMDDLHNDCLSSLTKFVKKHNLKVLLKSHTSIYHDNETMYFNTSGNDGLAKGGSGDILAGLIAAFIAQKVPVHTAAGMAAYYLGMTAEFLSEKRASMSITPTDILNRIFRYANETDETEA